MLEAISLLSFQPHSFHCAPGQAIFTQDGFAVRQAIAQQFASAADFEERVGDLSPDCFHYNK